MTQEQFDRLVSIIKFLLGAGAAIAVFILAQTDIELSPIAKVVLGAYLVFAAYVSPATLVRGTTFRQIDS